MFSIEFSPTAKKQLAKLENQVQARVISVLERIQYRPFSFVIKLAGLPYYRLRVGDYRVLIEIDQKKQVILVAEVGHRKNIYDL